MKTICPCCKKELKAGDTIYACPLDLPCSSGEFDECDIDMWFCAECSPRAVNNCYSCDEFELGRCGGEYEHTLQKGK